MNSYPFLAIEQLLDLLRAGADSLKIQGRENSIDLVLDAVKLYRRIVNSFMADPEGFVIPQALVGKAREIDRLRHQEMRNRTGVMIREMLGIDMATATAKGTMV
jgi:collagenase-like PrtC family protease